MSRPLWIFTACLAAGLLAGCTKEAETEPEAVSIEQQAESGGLAVAPQAPPRAAKPDPSFGTRAISVSEIQATELSVLAALSTQEASWLEKNGFPTPGDLAQLPYVDEARLVSEMHKGNGKAAALLGHKRELNGDLRGASAAFARGAQLGSIYARERHAILELMRTSEIKNGQIVSAPAGHKAVFVARLEVARMLGDHRVDHYIEQYASDVDRQFYSDDILAMAGEFMRQYGLTEAPRPPDPRPNAALWEEIASASPSSTIVIHERPPLSR